jgi:signal transduction histidine kinase
MFEEIAHYKVRMLYLISLIGLLAMIPLGIIAFLQTHHWLGTADFTAATGVTLNALYLRKTGNYALTSHFGTAFVGLFFLFLFVTGGAFHTGPLWLYTFPLIASFLVGSKHGSQMSIVLLAAALVSQLLKSVWPIFASYPKDFLIRFVPSFLVVLLYAYLYERATERHSKRLASTNAELDKRIREQTEELVKANAALQEKIEQSEKAERDLRLAHEQFVTVLDGIDASIYVADMKTFEILFANKYMNDAFGQNAVGAICYRLFRQETTPCDPCTNSQLIDDEGNPTGLVVWEGMNPITHEWYINYDRAVRWMDGRVVRLQVAMNVTRLKETEGALKKIKAELEERVEERTANLVNMNRELTLEIERHKRTAEALAIAKEAADKANRAKSEFLACMSHELRTPLNHIIGFTELVVGKNLGDLNETQEEYLGDVVESSKHLLSLINDILDLSRVESGKMKLNIGEVRIREVLEGSLVMISEKALKHGIRVERDLDGVPEVIRADEMKLKQIMYNLLSNAVKFTPDGGEVRVSAGVVGGDQENLGERSMEISVADSGIGIQKGNLERIFEPFEQVDNAMSRKYQGTGLGLSLCRSLVELHGGRIWAESEGEGKGSTFRFILPQHPGKGWDGGNSW